ncbi:MAG TPA: ABC transporter substrate-binding protein [Actinotalea sp.]|nr:ABC transporter substrate-binding protein [Actinotalea sp.]
MATAGAPDGSCAPARRRPAVRHRAARVGALGALLCAALAATACTPPATPDPTPAGGQVEVFSWWASGAEKLAMDTLVGRFRTARPEVTYVDGALAGGAGSVAKGVLASRFANGDPPDTFQVHGGAELAAHVAQGHLAPITDLAERLDLAAALPPDVLDAVSVDGVVYAVPVNIHRANLLWANTNVLRAAGLDPTSDYPDLDSWLDALAAVREAGLQPLVLGSTWTQVHLLEVVLLSRLGPDGYSGLFDGRTDAMSPAVASALADFARLLGYTNADRDSLDWQDAAGRVAAGEAAFTVMGDWAAQMLRAPVTWAPFPGTDGVADVVIDAFAQPAGARHPEGAQAWLATIAEPDHQVAFANVKGAIPARGDIPETVLGTYQRTALGVFRSGTRVPSLAHGMAASPAVVAEVTRITGALTRGTAATSQLQAALAAASSG